MSGRQRVVTWRVTGSGGFETAWAEFSGTALRARGRAVGTDPAPYWIAYELETGEGYVTRRLAVTAETADGQAPRTLDLRRGEDGQWTADGQPLPGPAGAEDCDLGLCPLTNTMPVLRYGLHRKAGRHDLLMAWVSVPDLTVEASPQTYESVGDGRVVFSSGDFRSEIVFDGDGLVASYPGMAFRHGGRRRA
ncbi:putative glycolipid-binding domain-containing protein [Streptomyces pathocidini]|uniref:Glycolipid-binding domain-containing protein n=1 Tax=Streptomyces pathocidini TaxID=1650571 RepID=A0ABW7UMN1_9ACTN|nr:putative glycolipid-binding domain-containing protein [Streptomyces pathocidini]